MGSEVFSEEALSLEIKILKQADSREMGFTVS